jgi:peptide-methionine (R)-S-oxide reductase
MEKINKTEDEWKAELNTQTFQVLRKHGTERAFSGEYNDHHDDGTYVCAGCGNALFDSRTKFNSGTGWPSFYEPIKVDAVETTTDTKFFMTRTEVHCAKCDGHLGHVFTDGPNPTGLRYCMNSVSLKFTNEKL